MGASEPIHSMSRLAPGVFLLIMPWLGLNRVPFGYNDNGLGNSLNLSYTDRYKEIPFLAR